MEKDQNRKDVKKFVKKSLKRTGFVLYLAETAILATLLAGVVFLWYNPQIVYEKIKNFYPQNEREVKYVIPETVTNAINSLNEQVKTLNGQTEQFMNVKADSSVVLSIVERMNTLEKKADSLAKISGNGALILSGAMLVRDAAERGNSFTYEAEILKTLSASMPEIEPEIEYVYNNSTRRFASEQSLINQYNQIYGEYNAPKESENTNWKNRIINKAKQYVNISEPNSEESAAYNPKLVMSKARMLVNNGDLALALNLLDEPENRELLTENPSLNEWYQNAQNKQKFYQNLNKIAAFALALMKTENMQNVQ